MRLVVYHNTLHTQWDDGPGPDLRHESMMAPSSPYPIFSFPSRHRLPSGPLVFVFLFTFIHLLAPPLSSIPKVRSVIAGDLLQRQSASPHKQAELVSLVLAISLFFPATNRLVPICIYHIMPRLTTYQSKKCLFPTPSSLF